MDRSGSSSRPDKIEKRRLTLAFRPRTLHCPVNNNTLSHVDGMGLCGICATIHITYVDYKWIKGNPIKRGLVWAFIEKEFPISLDMCYGYGGCTSLYIYNDNQTKRVVEPGGFKNVEIDLTFHINAEVKACLTGQGAVYNLASLIASMLAGVDL